MSTETKTLTNADAKIQPKLGVKALVQIGMLSAIAIILMMFEIPLPFAPTFYKIDLSEVPVLVTFRDSCFLLLMAFSQDSQTIRYRIRISLFLILRA